MAKTSAIQKNLRRIKMVKKYAKKRAELKKIINNKKLELSERFEAQLKLNKLPKNSAKIRIRNRCEVSGRPHGVYRKLKISRIALRDMASAGKIPGLTKSSWQEVYDFNRSNRRYVFKNKKWTDEIIKLNFNSIFKFQKNILEILKKEGYIKDFFIEKTENNKISLKINLKYYEGYPVIKEIKRISKPGRRVYSRATSIPKVMNGLGLAILSTPKGVMSDTEARKNNVGGEIICRVF